MAAVVTHIEYETPPRPRLHVIEGGRNDPARPRTEAAPDSPVVPWRLVAAVGLVIIVALSFVARANPVSPAGDPSADAAPLEVSGSSYTVRPGDTLWGIAGALESGLDITARVDALSDANGGPYLVPGQVLTIPASLR